MAVETQPLSVVGIGASAGGVDALERLFRHLPSDTGLAFVVLTHLAPDRQSLLPEIVGRFTQMTVVAARDGLRLEGDIVYVLPENALLEVEGGTLKMRALAKGQRERKPIDIFLGSLARDFGERAVGVVLSGGDGDGTLGVKAIKERGGLTLAQATSGGVPAHPDMPQSAIATGLVDFAVPAEEMGARLLAHARTLEVGGGEGDEGGDPLERARPEIYRLLRTQIGHDFSGYKSKTFVRRVQRRMQVIGLDDVSAYIERLQSDPGEVAALFRDLLINVTSFFRDEEAFAALETLVIPKLFEGRGAEDTVRVWVPGCATGEEVYSIAMLMREHMDTLRGTPRVQIFATDIDERSLTVARAARYPEALLDGVTPERLRRFFTCDGASYAVVKEVRDLCIFSPHSVIRDPPFSRMDLVSCRNLLIYFGPTVQEQVIPTFHYSLRPDGYLFLGTSENVTQHSGLFAPIDKSHRIFRAREDGRPRINVPLGLNFARSAPGAPGAALSLSHNIPLRQSVEQQVLDRHAPPHVVVNAEGDIVYYSSRTGKYLEAAPGAPTRSLLTMARRGVRLELRTALREAVESRRAIVREHVQLETSEDRIQMITLAVEPISDRGAEEPLFLVTFADVGPTLSREDALARVTGPTEETIEHLEQELRETRDRLQSMIEEYETAVEELKSSNEELVSVNEEFQSANEELEASKEELQSLNEELQTVNSELSHKLEALDQSNSDLNNLFESTQIATIFLDKNLNIRNFTPPVAAIFNLVPSDRGRPLTDFAGRLDYPELQGDVLETLRTAAPIEKRVEGNDGISHFLVRLRPYSGLGSGAEGVIVTFIDVTSAAEAEAHQRVLIAELNHRVKNMLTVVIGVARQTARGAASADQYASDLISRLESMARSYELLSRENWKSARIDELAHLLLDLVGPGRVRLEGPELTLRPKQALSIGMILHELATNAVKYGALSGPEGRIELTWSISGEAGREDLHLVWSEEGGPALTQPRTSGFGLKLLERETSHGLGGRATTTWRASGLRVDLHAPLSP